MQTTDWPYKRKVLTLIAVCGIIRLIFAFTVQLANDESYYWLYSQHLKLNYFDHPPMIALWIRISTLNLWLQNYTGFIRLSSVISCSIATWFMFKCVSLISNERAGWLAACLYNASFYAGITAGILVMPDSPQMIFWTGSLWLIASIVKHENSWKYWCLFGISTGLCIMSKVHGVFIWIGMGAYILSFRRTWLTNPRVYVSVLISVVICLPILLWNIKYNFATYQFNEGRVNIYGVTHDWFYLLKESGGQLLINNPVNVILVLIALFSFKKRALKQYTALSILNFIGLLHAGILLVISSYKETLPHWSGPAYVTLLPLAAVYLDIKTKNKKPFATRLSLAMHVFVLFAIILLIDYYPGNFGVPSGKRVGYGDMSLDSYGWKQAGKNFDSIYTVYQQKKLVAQNTPVICNKWWGAHIEYHFCLPKNIKMIGLGEMMNLHEYTWMNNQRKNSVDMQKAFCIVPSDEFYDVREMYKKYYNKVDSITSIQLLRGGKPAHSFYVYLLSGWKGEIPVIN